MAGVAYACRIIEENFDAIASENPKFDRKELLDWLETYESGYFLREEGSPFDCKYITDETFLVMYRFEAADEAAMFRKVVST